MYETKNPLISNGRYPIIGHFEMFQVVGHVNNGHGRYITRWPSYKLNIHLMMDSGHKS